MQSFYGQYTVDRGSAAAPSFSFNGVTTSGLFGRSDGGVGISVGGVEAARWETGRRFFSRFSDFLKTVSVLTFYGTATWSPAGATDYLNWTGQFIANVPMNVSAAGILAISAPASGTAIAVQGAASRTTTANGFNLTSGDVLVAVITPGGNNAYSFLIVPQQSATEWPDNWVFIGAREPNTQTMQLGSGQVITKGFTYNSVTGWGRFTDGRQILNNELSAQVFAVTNVGKVQYGATTRTDGDFNADASSQLHWSFGITGADTNFRNTQILIDTTKIRLNALNDGRTDGAGIIHFTRSGYVVTSIEYSGSLISFYDGQYDIGSSTKRVKSIYLVNQPTVSSDVSGKMNVRALSNAEIDAWSNVSAKVYNLMTTAGTASPLLSAGLIAQDVISAFTNAGLDYSTYNLFDKDPAGKFLLKYGECAMFEAAYQRSRVSALNASVQQLKSSLGGVLKLLNLPALP